ncbi:DNA-binding protein [Paenibacillus sp. ACRRX]|uniref:DNA-binding protein n=1 Tax=unclassified Paenibacillus TaxID=185978 RepID=UPI001EF62126|nr:MULTISPECIES: DNA-binding protein [unclassified Paenibacillus]MCG7406316.1 DNA-binding protein [Paenibacillus sp. ACRRX]MDK8179351.1 DNA-binding protein [Paenibacillus sp. UMB4589-SE434]
MNHYHVPLIKDGVGMRGDYAVLWFIIIGLVVWGVFASRRALFRSEPMEQIYLSDHYVHDDETERLLEQEGYEIVGGKFSVPIRIRVDEHEELSSRLWVDLIVRQNEDWYVVRCARERMQLDWTASGIRKLWTTYFLAFPDCAGVVIVDMAERSVRVIRMDVGEPSGSSE